MKVSSGASKWVMLIGLIVIPLLSGCATSKAPPGPPLQRIAEWRENPRFDVGDGDEIMRWLNMPAPAATVYTPEARWPNGLAASMTPILVDWEKSSFADPARSYVMVHNVYVSGNPIVGKSRLATIRIPSRGIERVEFVLVRYHLKGLAKMSGHVQLRFVFHADRRPELLDADGRVDESRPFLDDLVLSWEAWRPTLNAWTFTEGLKPSTYVLTPRMFAGNQRFLQDALRGAVWDCYPLQLPDYEEAEDMVLLSGLQLGDGFARNMIWSMLNDDIIPDPDNAVTRLWEEENALQARKKFHWEEMPDDPIKDLTRGLDPSYHALTRSCINITLAQIEIGMDRLYGSNNLGDREHIKIRPATIPKWFDDVAEGRFWASVYRAPYALWWLMGNREVLPYKSYLPLKNAGLLRLDESGRIIFYRYGHRESSPYGSLKEKIM